ncbi:type VII secretion protein EccB [Saccharopolyspora sp. 5N708]|uniref:type VII secretion protein EccB n=1 Tax=Saccharopolyspora sp. 5N708 TaxID=3457424 RepID=UPI003FD3FBE3
MQTQRDHVHAYQFLMGRMSSALVVNDPASAEVPSRRALTGLIIGIVLALLIAIGFGVYGLIRPGGNTSWRQSGAIVVERETGTRYVNVDGLLHPTVNYASAMLLQGANAKVQLISRASLVDAPRGVPIGIPDAPQALPTVDNLVGSHWLACLPDAGPTAQGVNLDFDPATPADLLPPDRYALVEAVGGVQYLLSNGMKHRVADPTVTAALGMAAVRPVPAPQPWLNALPEGQVLSVAEIEDAGKAGPAVGGRPHPVGQLFEHHAANGAVELFVLRADGLAPLSRTEFQLLDARPGSPDPVPIDAAAVVSTPRSPDRSLTQRIPDLSGARWEDPGARAICLRQVPVGAQVTSQVAFAARWEATSPSVRVPLGHGVVVASMPAPPRQRVPDRYLITDQGIRYLMPDDDSIRALGFSGAPVYPIANELLSALPPGPELSRAAMGVE